MFASTALRSSIFLLLALYASAADEDDEKYLHFPPNFLFGTSTAAYQVEGAWNVSDKGQSTWDYFVHTQNSRIFHGDTGDVAADSYHKYKEDVALMKTLGFKSYRFSVSWPRILPQGFSNYISKDGVRYYHDLIDELLKNDIEPIIALYHWDHPQVLEEYGGWLNSEIVNWFGDFARVVFREYGSKVKKFIPLNEPLTVCLNGYSNGGQAPAKPLHGFGEYLCMHNMLKAHATVYRIYEKEFKPVHKGEVGYIVTAMGYLPKTPEDKQYADIAFEFNIGWVMHPIYSKEGDYPAIMKSMINATSYAQGYSRSRLPEFSQEWIDYIRGTSDFLAVNHYTSRMVTKGTMGLVPSLENDQQVLQYTDKSWKPSASSWLWVVPEGFRFLLNQLKDKYGNPTMYITENGVTDLETLEDDSRIYYFREYLKQMLLAIHVDGVNLKGYLFWSIIDNFEWNRGYYERFGIVHVDFNDPARNRTMKKSAHWWKNVIATGKIDTN